MPGVSADGSPTTTSLTLTFDREIAELAAADITLSGVESVEKGELGGAAPVYSLPVSGFTTGGALEVAVEKAGYRIIGLPAQVTLVYSAPAPQTPGAPDDGGGEQPGGSDEGGEQTPAASASPTALITRAGRNATAPSAAAFTLNGRGLGRGEHLCAARKYHRTSPQQGWLRLCGLVQRT